jgi:hypothetical protein
MGEVNKAWFAVVGNGHIRTPKIAMPNSLFVDTTEVFKQTASMGMNESQTGRLVTWNKDGSL